MVGIWLVAAVAPVASSAMGTRVFPRSALRLLSRIGRSGLLPGHNLVGLSRSRSDVRANSPYLARMVRTFSGSGSSATDKSPTPTTPTTTKLEDADDADLIVSHFQNRMVHRLWSERAKAKKEKGKSSKATTANGKTPSESEVAVEYPFTTNEVLAESYRSPWNTMRIGRLLEDLDALAGNIAFYHVRGGDDDTSAADKVHPLLVTASVDRIVLRHPPSRMPCDQVLSGRVTYVGTSSMEIRMTCTENHGDNAQPREWLEAFFTFVTLDPETKTPMSITPLLPETDQERSAFQRGQARAKQKKERRKRQQKHASDHANELQQTAQQLLQQARPLLLHLPSAETRHAVFLSATLMQNAFLAQPQVRNLHHRIFGGYLMRRAFELAFANAYVFGGGRPRFVEVDEISFAAPVDVGDLLVFNSRVIYTSSNNHGGHHQDGPEVEDRVHVEVEAWVTVPEQANAKLSNQFYFTFAIQQLLENKLPLRRILPSNMDEAMRMASRMEADQAQALQDSMT